MSKYVTATEIEELRKNYLLDVTEDFVRESDSFILAMLGHYPKIEPTQYTPEAFAKAFGYSYNPLCSAEHPYYCSWGENGPCCTFYLYDEDLT